MKFRLLIAVLLIAALPTLVRGSDSVTDPELIAFFEKNVRPLLVNNCYTCHSADTNSKGGLRVDDRGGLLTGGASGPAVVPGNPDESLIVQVIGHADDVPKMPPKKKLTNQEIADLKQWIKDGAAWPEVRVPTTIGKANPKYDELRKSHWAWQPLKTPVIPVASDPSWAKDDLDRFVLAKLDENGLKPAGDADRVALIRRLTFDLTGLPPNPAEIDQFLADPSEKYVETLVDRLLASPAFGERWARHWLDVARYGESTGSSRNLPLPHAWRYRDYVINAFTSDKPYDQFIREQIAGDLLPADSPE